MLQLDRYILLTHMRAVRECKDDEIVWLKRKSSPGTQTCKDFFPLLTTLPWGISFESLGVLKVPKLNTYISIYRLGRWYGPRKQQRNSPYFSLSSAELIPITNKKDFLRKRPIIGENFPWVHRISIQVFNLKKQLSLSQQK